MKCTVVTFKGISLHFIRPHIHPKHYENCENSWVPLEKRLFKVAQTLTGKTVTKINFASISIKDTLIFKGRGKVIFKEDILGKRILKMDLFLF